MPTLFFADLVRELAQEGGTGPLTPTGAVPGHRRFAEAVPTGVSFHYAVAGIARPEQWEVGTGRIGSDGRLLRDMVAASSADGAAVDFAPGLKTIALTVGAGWFAASDTQAATLASDVAGFGDELASLASALDAKQPLSTTHDSAGAGEATDAVTVRRGAGWVNIPLSALAFRGGDGRYVLDGALSVQRSVDGDILDVGKDGGQRLRMFADAAAIGLFNVASAGAGRDGLRILDGAVAFDIGASEVGRFSATGLELTIPNGGQLFAEQAGSGSVKLRSSATMQYETAATSSHQFLVGGGEVARILASGGSASLGVGTASPDAFGNWGVVHASGSNGGQLSLTRSDGAARAQLWVSSSVFRIETKTNQIIEFNVNNVSRFRMTMIDFRPAVDDGYNLGAAAFRFNDIFATNGTINTSDAREKAWCGGASEAELRAARRIVGELGFFQWNAAIAAKGEGGARLHFGVRAQAVWAIMADEGLIEPVAEGAAPSSRYAFLCHDEWDGGAVGLDPLAGDRFGIRTDQLALFLIAAQEARLAALETAP